MALPITHPLWASFAVILPIAFVTALIVYLRAEHIAAPAVVALKGARWLRRAGSVGAAASAAVFGVVAAIVYSGLLQWLPDSAAAVFSTGGIVVGAALGAAAVALRRDRGLEGTWEVVLLSLLWGCGYGVSIPFLSSPPG